MFKRTFKAAQTRTFLLFGVLFLFTFVLSGCNPQGVTVTGTNTQTITVGETMQYDFIKVHQGDTEITDFELDVNDEDLDTDVVGDYIVNVAVIYEDEEIFRGDITVQVVDYPASDHPYITGTKNHTFVMGDDPINFFEGVTVLDAKYGDITGSLMVDTSQVDFNTVGVYDVIYFVENHDGYQDRDVVQVSVSLVDDEFSLPDDFIIVRLSSYYGIHSIDGTMILDIIFDKIEYLGDSIVMLSQSGNTLYYNLSTEEYIEFDYEPEQFINGISVFENDGKYGYISSDNTIIVPSIYDDAEPFSEDGYAKVGLLGLRQYMPSMNFDTSYTYGYIDTTGEIVIDIKYETLNLLYINEDQEFDSALFNARIYNQNPVILDSTGAIKYDLLSTNHKSCEFNEVEYYLLLLEEGYLIVDDTYEPFTYSTTDDRLLYMIDELPYNDTHYYIIMDDTELYYTTNSELSYFNSTLLPSFDGVLFSPTYEYYLENGVFILFSDNVFYAYDDEFTLLDDISYEQLFPAHDNIYVDDTSYSALFYVSYYNSAMVRTFLQFDIEDMQWWHTTYNTVRQVDDFFLLEKSVYNEELAETQYTSYLYHYGLLSAYSWDNNTFYEIGDTGKLAARFYTVEDGYFYHIFDENGESLVNDKLTTFNYNESYISARTVTDNDLRVYSPSGALLLEGLEQIQVVTDNLLLVSTDTSIDNPYQLYNLTTDALSTDYYHDLGSSVREDRIILSKMVGSSELYGVITPSFTMIHDFSLANIMFASEDGFIYYNSSTSRYKIFNYTTNSVLSENFDYVASPQEGFVVVSDDTTSERYIIDFRGNEILNQTEYGSSITSLTYISDTYYLINDGTTTTGLYDSATDTVVRLSTRRLYYSNNADTDFVFYDSSYGYYRFYTIDIEDESYEEVSSFSYIIYAKGYGYYTYPSSNDLYRYNNLIDSSYDGNNIFVINENVYIDQMFDDYGFDRVYTVYNNNRYAVTDIYYEITSYIDYNDETLLLFYQYGDIEKVKAYYRYSDTSLGALDDGVLVDTVGSTFIIEHTDGTFSSHTLDSTTYEHVSSATLYASSYDYELEQFTFGEHFLVNLDSEGFTVNDGTTVYTSIDYDPTLDILYTTNENQTNAFLNNGTVIQDVIDDIEWIIDDVYKSYTTNNVTIFNSEGTIITTEFDDIYPMEDTYTYFTYEVDGYFGVVHKDGTVILEHLYQLIFIENDNYFVTVNKSLTSLFALDGTLILDSQFSSLEIVVTSE